MNYLGKFSNSTAEVPGYKTPARLLFNRPTRGIPQRFSGQALLCDNDETTLSILINRQPQLNEDVDTHKNIPFYIYRMNCSSAEGRPQNMDVLNCSWTWNRRPQYGKLQHNSNQD